MEAASSKKISAYITDSIKSSKSIEQLATRIFEAMKKFWKTGECIEISKEFLSKSGVGGIEPGLPLSAVKGHKGAR